MMPRLLNIYSSSANFARSIWPVIQVGSTLYPPLSIANIWQLTKWCGSEVQITYKGESACHYLVAMAVEMTRGLMIKILLSCKLSINA
jgi:hypothetical protein